MTANYEPFRTSVVNINFKHMNPMISMITISNCCGKAAFVSKQSEGIQDFKHLFIFG